MEQPYLRHLRHLTHRILWLAVHARIEHRLSRVLWGLGSRRRVHASLLLVLRLLRRHVLLIHAGELLPSHWWLLHRRDSRLTALRRVWHRVSASRSVLWPALVLRCRVLPRYYVNEEVEHVALG